MHHLAKITFGKVENRPFHGECACGTAGDFASNEAARDYLVGHLVRLQGINSGDLVDETVQPLPVPQPEPEPAVIPAQQQEQAEEQEAPAQKVEEEGKAEAAGE